MLFFQTIAAMYAAITSETSTVDIINDISNFFWPIDYCGAKIQHELIEKTKKVKNILLCCLV